jgi:hypothetical protein
VNEVSDKRIKTGFAEELSTGPYPKPDASSPYLPILFLEE